MTNRLVMGHYRGKDQFFIQKAGGDASLDDIHHNTADFVFHSDFNNLVEIGSAQHTFAIPRFAAITGEPQWGGKTSGVAVWVRRYITRFKLSGVAVGADIYCVTKEVSSGAVLEGGFVLRMLGDATQFAMIEYISGSAYLRIETFIGDTTLPAMSITVRSQLFKIDTQGNDGSGILAEVTPERVRFKEGRFDSDRNWLSVVGAGFSEQINLPTKPVLKIYNEKRTVNTGTGNVEETVFSVTYNFNGIRKTSVLTQYQPNQVPIRLGVI